MNTSDSLTVQLPKLGRLLLDGDIDPELALYLKAVGFEVRFAPRGSKTIRDDVKVLQLARREGRILVCHDQHKDKETKLRLYPEMHKRGGKILQIGGDSSQNVFTALGKIIIWHEQWSPWFEENDGKVIVHKERPYFKTALMLVNTVISQQSYDVGQVLSTRKRKPRKKVIRKRHIPPEQTTLIQ